MSTEQELRTQLLATHTELEERLHKIHQELRKRDEPLAADFAEQVVEQENIDVLYALEDEGKHELALVKRALQRLQDGGYGLCCQCGTEISAGRLAALPYTSNCIDCAE